MRFPPSFRSLRESFFAAVNRARNGDILYEVSYAATGVLRMIRRGNPSRTG